MSIPPDERGLLLGDGLFETILWVRGAPVLFDAHAARLERGCAVLGLPAPQRERLRAAAVNAVSGAGLQAERCAIRLTWTAGSGGRGLNRPAEPTPRLLASAALAPVPTGPVRLATVAIRRNEGSPASRLKSLAYLDSVLARQAALGAGADEALMLNNAGEVACAAAANLFWFEDDRLVTPALDCGVLEGVARGQVIDLARSFGLDVIEAHRDAGALAKAKGLFLTNSLIGARPVSHLDGAPVGEHPARARLAEALTAQFSGI